LQQLGRYYEPQELAALLLRDKSYYRLSSGGVTLSGGECLQYPEYLQALLMILKRENIHLALQTAGYFDYDACEHSVFPYVAVVYFDVKIMNSSKHKFYTGRGNSLILENLTRLAGRKDLQLRPRVPLIPGITTSSENLTAIAEFLVKIGVQKVSFLPYNPLGLSMVNPLGGVSPPLLNRFLSAKEHEDILSVCASIFRNFEIG
jgi:pyruvate formate lyase activating enzyme